MYPSDHCDGAYASGFVCNVCSDLIQGERWFCAQCSEDICFPCWSTRVGAKGAGRKRPPRRRKEEPAESWQRDREQQPTPTSTFQFKQQQQQSTPKETGLRAAAPAGDDPNVDGGACPVHKGQRLTLFCMAHRTALCVKCLHQGRTPDGEALGDAVWLPFDDAAQDVRSFVEQQASALRTRRQTLADDARQHMEAHDAAKQEVAQATEEVRAHFKELTALLKQREEQLVGELQSVLNHYEDSCRDTSTELDRALQDLDESLAVAHDVSTGVLSSRELLTNFEGIARSLSGEVAAPMPELPPTCEIKVDMGPSDVTNIIGSMGSIQASVGGSMFGEGDLEATESGPVPLQEIPISRRNSGTAVPKAGAKAWRSDALTRKAHGVQGQRGYTMEQEEATGDLSLTPDSNDLSLGGEAKVLPAVPGLMGYNTTSVPPPPPPEVSSFAVPHQDYAESDESSR